MEIRNRVWRVYKYIETLTYEIEGLRHDESTSTGEVRNAIALLIQDKYFKIENAIIHLSHHILQDTLPEADWMRRPTDINGPNF